MAATGMAERIASMQVALVEGFVACLVSFEA